MSDEPQKPKRRRWLIVAFVLVLESLGTWWNWPRGDARFVGRWIMTNNDTTFPRPVIELHATERGTLHYPATPQLPNGEVSSFFWRVEGAKYIEGLPANGLMTPVIRLLRDLRLITTDHWTQGDESRFEMIEVSPEIVRLRFTFPSGEVLNCTFTRIPE